MLTNVANGDIIEMEILLQEEITVKKNTIITVAVILVFAIAVTCLHVFVFIPDRAETADKKPVSYSFPILAEIYEGEWLVEDLDQDAPVTLGTLADILYTIAGKPELEVPKSLADTPAFKGKDIREALGTDLVSGEAHSDSFIWCLLNGVFYVEGNFESVSDPDDTAAEYNRENYFHDWVFRITDDDKTIAKTVNGEYVLHSVKPTYPVSSVTEVTANDAAVALYRLTEEYFDVDMSRYEVKHFGAYDTLVESEFKAYDKHTLYFEDGEVIVWSVTFTGSGDKSAEGFTVSSFGKMLAKYIKRLEELEREPMI